MAAAIPTIFVISQICGFPSKCANSRPAIFSAIPNMSNFYRAIMIFMEFLPGDPFPLGFFEEIWQKSHLNYSHTKPAFFRLKILMGGGGMTCTIYDFRYTAGRGFRGLASGVSGLGTGAGAGFSFEGSEWRAEAAEAPLLSTDLNPLTKPVSTDLNRFKPTFKKIYESTGIGHPSSLLRYDARQASRTGHYENNGTICQIRVCRLQARLLAAGPLLSTQPPPVGKAQAAQPL